MAARGSNAGPRVIVWTGAGVLCLATLAMAVLGGLAFASGSVISGVALTLATLACAGFATRVVRGARRMPGRDAPPPGPAEAGYQARTGVRPPLMFRTATSAMWALIFGIPAAAGIVAGLLTSNVGWGMGMAGAAMIVEFFLSFLVAGIESVGWSRREREADRARR